MSNLAAADLALRGLRVFPLSPGHKFPRAEGWQEAATDDVAKALDLPPWFGVATDGLFVLDADAKSGGIESLERLRSLGAIPATFTTRTPSGGVHMVFKPRDGERFRSRAYRRMKDGREVFAIDGFAGLDIRADGGLVVGAGSAAGAKAYRIESDAPFAELPEFIAALARRAAPRIVEPSAPGAIAAGVTVDEPGAVTAATAYLMAAEPAIEGQCGDPHTIVVANRCMDLGVSPETTAALMLEHWNDRCAPPWDADDLQRKVYSAAKSRQTPIGSAIHDAAFDIVPTQEPAPTRTFGERIKSLSFAYEDIATIPPRAWLADRKLMRKKLSLLVAAGGTGKSLVSIQWAIALALGDGRKFGITVRERVRVLLVNLEDEGDEMRRRVAAVCLHFGIPPETLEGWLLTYDDREGDFMVARRDKSGRGLERTPLASELAAYAAGAGVGAIIVDPFAETHAAKENDNDETLFVAKTYRAIAETADAAVLLVHHTSKPPKADSSGHAGNINSSRGASSLINAVRIGMTLYGMSGDEAKALGIPENERASYVRLDDSAKANLGKRSGEPEWFRWQSITLPNTDEVGVLAPVQLATGNRHAEMWAKALALVIQRADAGEPIASNPKGNNGAPYMLRGLYPEYGDKQAAWADVLVSLAAGGFIETGTSKRNRPAFLPTEKGREEFSRSITRSAP
jgi:hypothetical protein